VLRWLEGRGVVEASPGCVDAETRRIGVLPDVLQRSLNGVKEARSHLAAQPMVRRAKGKAVNAGVAE
jgi:hypothetical protein